MATITAADVKKLRDQTGAGMMDCKAALTEANGDFEEAITILRKRGWRSAAKKAGRAASEGLIGHRVADDHRAGIARRGELRVRLRRAHRRLPGARCRTSSPRSTQAGDAATDGVARRIRTARSRSGSPRRSPSSARTWRCRASCATPATGYVGQYIHMGGKIGVLVELERRDRRRRAHATSSRRWSRRSRCRSPRRARSYVTREEVPADVAREGEGRSTARRWRTRASRPT